MKFKKIPHLSIVFPFNIIAVFALSDKQRRFTFRIIVNFLKVVFMKIGYYLIAFAGGLLSGGVAALLFAPKKGEDLRREIKAKVDDAKEHIAADLACLKPDVKVFEKEMSMALDE